ncbi:MAG: outer membrane protein OmpK [Balneolales bacterium]
MRTLLPFIILYIVPAICIFSPPGVNAQATYQGSSGIEFLYGEDFPPAGNDLVTVTPTHSGIYGVFEQYGFVDLYYEAHGEETSAHLEWYPKMSLSRLSGRQVGAGPVTDILLGAGINVDFGEGSNPWVWLAGPAWKFAVPGFDSFQLETYYYRQVDYNGNEFKGTYQITPSWDIFLPLSEQLRFRFTGFVDFIGDRGPGHNQIITQPQFLLDIGNLWNNPGRIFAGTEWRYWHNKGGVEGVTESVPQLELRIEL